jgi:phosphatidate cytidylyltransferase
VSNLTTRVLVAAVGIPLILLVTLAGGFYFYGFVLLVTLLGVHELFLLAEKKGVSPQVIPGMVLAALVVTVFLYVKVRWLVAGTLLERGIRVPFPTMAQSYLILSLLAVPVILAVELFRNKPGAIANVAVTLLGAGYVALFLGSLLGLRELFIPEDFPVYAYFGGPGQASLADAPAVLDQWGGRTVIAIFASIWICDSAAYFAGRAWGKHLLFVRVSPKKTWEGAIAGCVAAVATFVAARSLALPYLSLTGAVLCGLVVGVCGQAGDLVESLLKRDAGVKDSSALIPGHGGVLDRFDSLMFVSPLIFLYLDFVVF